MVTACVVTLWHHAWFEEMDLGTKILLVKRAAKASVKIVDLLHKNIADLFRDWKSWGWAV